MYNNSIALVCLLAKTVSGSKVLQLFLQDVVQMLSKFGKIHTVAEVEVKEYDYKIRT